MANGGTLHALVDEGKGRWAVMATVMMTLATGVGWYFSQEGRDYTDERIAAAVAQRAGFTDYRYTIVNDRLAKLEARADRRDEEVAKLWSEMSKRIDRQWLMDSQAGDDRRFNALERAVEQLQRALYGDGRRSQQ